MNQDTFKIPGREIQCCGNCEYGSYDKMQGYVCVNGDSEYCADFVEYDHTCEKYHDDMEIDIIHGRQTVDGCSLMGVISLLGNFVTVYPHSEDKELIQKFSDELERIKCT